MIAVLLQTSLVSLLPVVPDLLLILCVYLGIYHRSVGGAAAAFFLGYGLDSCSGAPVGTNAFAMSLVFAAVSAIARQLWLNNPFSVLCMVFFGVILKTGAVLLLTDFGRFAFLLAADCCPVCCLGRRCCDAVDPCCFYCPLSWRTSRLRRVNARGQNCSTRPSRSRSSDRGASWCHRRSYLFDVLSPGCCASGSSRESKGTTFVPFPRTTVFG